MQAKTENKKIVCVHLLNDYSGSPLILSMVIRGLIKSGHNIDLVTSRGKEGFISNLDVNYRYLDYRFHENKWIRLLRFFKSQVSLFFIILSYRKQNIHLYINTLLPFGAALAGKIMGKKVTYHLHESYIQPELLKRFLKSVASACANSAIYVSNYLMQAEKLKGVKNTVIYNALPDEFVQRSGGGYYLQQKKDFVVLMISSLKSYKGVYEFVKLAWKIREIKFELVLNAGPMEIKKQFHGLALPDNLLLYPVQKDVHPFYQRASIVVNLSNPEQCVETFGMTLLEGMCYGIPVIGPSVGGPAEMVTNGVNGYCIDSRNIEIVEQKIRNIYNDKELQKHLSKGALQTAEGFEEQNLHRKVEDDLAN